MKELVTMKERLWINNNATKEMGTKIKSKVIDIDKVVTKMTEIRKKSSLTPFIEIQPISANLHKKPNRQTTFQKDPITGVLYGIPVGEDTFGNIKWQRIQLEESLSLNLDNINDARQWVVLRFRSDIQGTPFPDGSPHYKIFDPVEKSRIEMKEVKAMKIAFERVEKINNDPKAMVNFARFLAEELQPNINHEILEGLLLKAARNNPIEFNKKWDIRDRAFHELFESARALGIVSMEIDKGFVYKGIRLGMNSNESVKFLSEDETIMSSINTELKEKDDSIESVAKSMKKEEEKFEE